MSDSAELARLRAAIVAEIHWHSLEAERYRQAAEEARIGNYAEEEWLNLDAARHHTDTAARLHAILYPPEEENEP